MAINEVFGWVWVLVGVLSGLGLGMRFHEEQWMGGYGSLRRRMIRLGHISFIGLGFLNILFALSAPRVHLGAGAFQTASWTLVLGGVSMPACCGLMAWRPALRQLFVLPVANLVVGVALVVAGLLRS